MPSYRLATDEDMVAILNALEICPIDSSHIVIISDKKEKRSAKQLSFLWKLFRAVAASGIGNADTAEDVELSCKWRFLRPMLVSIDTRYAEILQSVEKLYAGDPAMMKFVTGKLFHFSDLNTAEMAEVLTQIIDYYTRHGVSLPDPSLYEYELENTI